MLQLPLPIVTSLLLVFLLLRFLVEFGARRKPLSLLVLGFYALQSLLVGLRWGGEHIPQATLAVTAAALPALTWGALGELAGHKSTRHLSFTLLLAFIASLLTYLAILASRSYLVDALSLLFYAGAALLLLVQAHKQGHAWFDRSPLGTLLDLKSLYRLAGALLLFSALTDFLISIAYEIARPQLAAQIVFSGNVILLALLAFAYLRQAAKRRAPEGKRAEEVAGAGEVHHANQDKTIKQRPVRQRTNAPVQSAEQLQAVLQKLRNALEQERLYCDETLSLEKLAAHLGIPARTISKAVNQLSGMSLPQLVNSYRLAEAARQLRQEQTTITQIMYATGFATKSNFNREFVKLYGVSPSAYRDEIDL